MPVSCTRVPGAWPTIKSLAVADARNTGLGPKGRCLSQIRQPRTSANNRARPDRVARRHGLRWTCFPAPI
jgi:hypothetical protein